MPIKSVSPGLGLILFFTMGSMLQAGPDGAVKRPVTKGTAVEAKPSLRPSSSSSAIVEEEIPVAASPGRHYKSWALVPTYSYSFFNKGKEGWHQSETQLYYQVNDQWSLGAAVDIRNRPPSGTDTYYSAMASYTPREALELHAKLSLSPDPEFLAEQVYSGGFQYQILPRLGLLLDYEGFNFEQGRIDQVKPGLTIGLTDQVSLGLKYVHGWAFSDLEYDFYAATLKFKLPGERLLSLAFAYGTDPNSELGAPGREVESLSPSYTASIFFRQPFGRDFSVFAGFEYVYRLDKDGDELYQQFTPSAGLAWKF
jgi:YaiO family outer membrane protein